MNNIEGRPNEWAYDAVEQRRRLLVRRLTRTTPIWIMAPTSFCGLVFLIVLYFRLNPDANFTWFVVFLPLWIGDIYTLTIKANEMHNILLDIWAEEHQRTEYFSLLKPICGVVDTVGSLGSKILLAQYLDETFHATLFVVLIPTWISAVISTVVRCMVPPVRGQYNARSMRYRLPMVLSGLYYFLGRGLQPFILALKLEGAVSFEWRTVFLPAWLLVLSEFVTATTLFHCAPLVHASTPRAVRRQAVRLMLLTGTQLYVMAVFSFLFLYWLTIRLDDEENNQPSEVSILQILSPLMVMSVLLLFIHPAMLYYSQQYQLLFRESLAGLTGFHDTFEQNGNTSASMLLEETTNPTYLLQISGTLYTPLEDKPISFGDPAERHDDVSRILSSATQEMQSSIEGKAAEDMETGVAPLPSDPMMAMECSNGAETGVQELEMTQRSTAAPAAEGESCIICFTASPDAVLMNCGHGGLCINCARIVAQRTPATCPVCRNKIRAVLHLSGFRELEDGRVVAYSNDGYEVREVLTPPARGNSNVRVYTISERALERQQIYERLRERERGLRSDTNNAEVSPPVQSPDNIIDSNNNHHHSLDNESHIIN